MWCCMSAVPLDAQQEQTPAQVSRPLEIIQFLGGAALGLGLHESGHVVLDEAFGAHPGVRKISAGFIPFFAITHDPVSPTKEFAISSAGFWVQHIGSEVLLSRRREIRHEHAPIAKGYLAFNVLTSVMYSGAAFVRAGPAERDTRGMAYSADIPEAWIGATVLAPAVLDTVRYYRPQSGWARWSSRAAKAGGALLLIKAAAR